MPPEKSQVVFDAWDTYVRDTADGPIFVSFDVEAADKDLSGSLPHSARVVLPIHKAGPNGGPVEPENQRLWDLEDELCETLSGYGVVCRLVGRLTHRGLRVLVFQLDSWDAFRAIYLAWSAECDDYEIQLAEGEGWEFFNDCVRPLPENWLFMADSKVVQGLIEAGSDPDKEHALEFVLQGEPPPLGRIAEALRSRGYRPLRHLDPQSGEIVLVKKMPLNLRAIAAESLVLSQMAEQFGVGYDGWGAAVVE